MTALLAAVTVVVTWPQAARIGTAVNDFGDPLLNSWTLAWVAHAIPAHPTALFDANIFHPETNTLAYSESLIVPALLVAPVLWAGGDPILAHNLVLLLGYVLSGLAMYVLVRSLTGRPSAAIIAAVAFTVYPYRIESYGKVQLQLIWWIPIALWAMHRIGKQPAVRPALLLGAVVAAQFYSCVYYGVFGLAPLAIVALATHITTLAPRARVNNMHMLAAVVSVVLCLPLLLAYQRAAAVVGERTPDEVRHWSAEPRDFARAPADNAMYGDRERPGPAERSLFPGYALPVVAAAALVPPISAPVVAYAVAAGLSADLAMGANGWGYQALFDAVPPFRALRVPARFAMMLGLALAVLAGLGVARLSKGRSRRVEIILAAAVTMAIVVESRPRSLDLSALADPRPDVYTWLAAQPPGVVCEYPVGPLGGRTGPQDPTYMYYSTDHWKPLVNGYSGFSPPSYGELLDRLRTFPSDAAVGYLRQRGVTYLLVHSPFYLRGDFDADVRALRARGDLEAAGRFSWKGGGVSEVFRIRR